MTYLPARLPNLLTAALKAGASVTVDPVHREGRDWMLACIIWTDDTTSRHSWRLGPDQVWSHHGPDRLQDTRARAEREAQS